MMAHRQRPMKRSIHVPVLRQVSGRHHEPRLVSSEEPGHELRGEQGEPAAEDDAADLPLGAVLAEHEHQPADDDRDEREGARERPGEGRFEIRGGALPRDCANTSAGKANRAARAPDAFTSTRRPPRRERRQTVDFMALHGRQPWMVVGLC
jgi:hypothetical protein